MSRFLDQNGSKLRIVGGLGELEQRPRLAREIVPTNHDSFPRTKHANTSRGNRDFVPIEMFKSVLLELVSPAPWP